MLIQFNNNGRKTTSIKEKVEGDLRLENKLNEKPSPTDTGLNIFQRSNSERYALSSFD